MKQYLWETHMHTSETSRCATNTAAEMVQAYRDAGYHGVIITDHFVNGYSTSTAPGPWHKRMDRFLKGYRAAKAYGDSIDMPVLLGLEFTHEAADFLTYGIDEDFLYDQKDLGGITPDELVARVHAAGGFISQAHPFRSAWYMPANVAKRWDIVDAIEVFNGSHRPENREWDDQALAMAQAHSLLETAGSDAHSIRQVATAATAFPEPFCTMDAFIAAMRGGYATIVRNAP